MQMSRMKEAVSMLLVRHSQIVMRNHKLLRWCDTGGVIQMV